MSNNIIYKEKGYMTASEFAELLGIKKEKVLYWDSTGQLLPVERTPGGRRYYNKDKLAEAVLLLAKERKKKKV